MVLGQIGFQVTVLEGGYKAFRAAMLAWLDQQMGSFRFVVVCGTTGSGKTRLLHALHRQGAQVLDLEDLAQHRSSVLGAIPGQAQPSQKGFDTLVWNALRGFDPERPVFVESESKKVGNVAIHLGLLEAMRASACVFIELPLPERVALLLEDYTYFLGNPAHFCLRLEALTAQRGKATVQAWQDAVKQGDFASVVRSLLTDHYDPVYLQSMERNFVQYAQAQRLDLSDRGVLAMRQAAAGLA
jgi:tRNA 2-selenouridine synthase